jgi:hypothetical protein
LGAESSGVPARHGASSFHAGGVSTAGRT